MKYPDLFMICTLGILLSLLLSSNYSGDQDSVIPLTGSRKLVHRLAMRLGLRTSTPYRVWFAGMQVSSVVKT